MIIDIEATAFNGIVCACLRDAAETAEWAIDNDVIDTRDVKEYKKIIKAIARVLDYIED
jgi:hypothetical protein